MKRNKNTLVFISLLLVSVSNICYADDSTEIDAFLIFKVLFFIAFSLVILGIPLYHYVVLPFIKKRKIQKFCDDNHLSYISESQKLPNNLIYKFIKINAGKKGECTYNNIIQGTRNGISFTMCDFSFRYSFEKGNVSSTNFPLIIIKNPNTSFPFFFLRKRNSLSGYQQISRVTLYGKVSLDSETKIKMDYKNHIDFYKNKKLNFPEDEQFSKKFDVDVEDEENVKTFFDDNIRRFFYEKAKPEYVYEGNGDYFIISTSRSFTFEEMIQFFEDCLKFYVELTSINSSEQ